MVATYRDTDGSPKEHQYYHAAGLAGHGGSSYIDSVIWRDKDANTGWNSAADATMEQRRYHCQNWRADVSAVLTDVGTQVETIKYTPYGTPICIPAGDVDQSGVTNASDASAISSWGGYEARADLDLDGDVDSADATEATNLSGTTGGRGVLSRSDTGSRKGYAGYESDATADAGGSRFWHVRHRLLDSTLGRWTRRDPLGYVDGMSLTQYTRNPTTHFDPHGSDDWANIDFVKHYFLGFGAPVTLRDIGLFDDYLAHPVIQSKLALARQKVAEFGQLLCTRLISQLDCPQGHVSDFDSGDFTIFVGREFVRAWPPIDGEVRRWMRFLLDDWTFSIGGHRLEVSWSCSAKAGCCPDPFSSQPTCSFSCEMSYHMTDKFTDPFSVARRPIPLSVLRALGIPLDYAGNVRFSSPYLITEDWIESNPPWGVISPCPTAHVDTDPRS